MDKKEYIERQEVYSKINKLPLTEDATMEILWAVGDIPTADAVPVVHGHWIDSKHTDTVICSRCKSCFSYETPYCPKCGAKMDGGNKNA